MCTYLQSDAFQQTWEEYKQTCSQSESFFLISHHLKVLLALGSNFSAFASLASF